MAGVGWADYNSKHGFGKEATVIGEENLAFAQMRREAEKAVAERRATPEQHAMVADVKRLWTKLRTPEEETEG
jgi:hypothetical protein